VEFRGTITTNGETNVKYQWEVRGDTNHTTSTETLNFDEADTKDVPSPGADSLDCGNYRITLHVINPNDMKANKNFEIEP
jgi:hypothetical protein